MSWVAIIGAAINAGSSIYQAQKSKQSASGQSDASAAAAYESGRQFDISRADFAPYREAGKVALSSLSTGVAPGGDLVRPFTMSDFESDPVTQASFRFGLDEGVKGVNRSFGARGMSKSGSAIKALERFAADYAGQRAGESYGRFVGRQMDVFNKEAAVAGIGQTASSQTAALGQNAATRVGELGIQGANARGAGSIAASNAYASGLGNISNSLQRYYYMNNADGGGAVSNPYGYGSPGYYNLGE